LWLGNALRIRAYVSASGMCLRKVFRMQEPVIVLGPHSFRESREESGSAVGPGWRNRKPGSRSVLVAFVSSGVVMGGGETHKEGVGWASLVAHEGIGCYC